MTNPKAMESGNLFFVGVRHERIMILNPAPLLDDRGFSPEQAINLAAWLVVMAGPRGDMFERLVREIEAT
jgi:hypothetical protein